MMSDYMDEIKDTVNEYIELDKIAVFVGAGVSRLSGFPSWSKLVLDMAKKIDYKVSAKDLNGNDRLSSDEYLKIPQIFYDNKGENEYKKIVRKQLNVLKTPNKIHKLIMRLKPNHILTTNYDTLLEQAANMSGKVYSVINSDSKVSTAPTRNYILKVHGDFEKNNFVLKESDYLNYDVNFKLIDNLMKSIFATHLVIFIGYSLGDYNIRLILNWVRQVQKDSFIEPVFVYTDDVELSEMELTYYKKENLKIVDANKLIKDKEKVDYEEKYTISILSLIDENRNEKWYRNDTWIIDHFYKMFEPLQDADYLRINDVASLFQDGKIFFTHFLKSDNFAYLLKAYKGKQKLSKKRILQLELIINRLFKSGIEGIQNFSDKVGEEFNSLIRSGNRINKSFEESYQVIRERIDNYSDDIKSLYSKAYDLYRIGRIHESYGIYYNLLTDCYSHKRWILYFFTQINLYYLRQTIILLNKDLSSIKGAFYFGVPTTFWDDNELYDIQLSHMLTDVPAEIKRYTFLEKLLAKNYYRDDVISFFQENYEIEKTISKRTYTMGQTPDQKAKIKIFDAIKFIYDNKLVFDRFVEHKSFVKIALRERYKGMFNQNELSKRTEWNENADVQNYIEFQEVLLMIRNFSFDDLYTFYEREEGDKLVLNEGSIIPFEKYICDLMQYFKDYILKYFDNAKMEYIFLKDEIKNALFMASYYAKEESTVYESAKYLFEALPINELSVDNRITMIERFKNNLSDSSKIVELIENAIMNSIQCCNKGLDTVIRIETPNIVTYANLLNKLFPDYKSAIVSKLLQDSRKTVYDTLTPLLGNIIMKQA